MCTGSSTRETNAFCQRPQESKRSLLLEIWRKVGREVKMHEINVHTINNFQRYVQSYGLPKLSICVLGQIYDHALVDLPRKPTPSVKDHRKARNTYYLGYGERWVDS